MNPLKQYFAIGKLVALLGAVALVCWQSSQIHRWHKQFDSERAAHQRDIDTYTQAQKNAAIANVAQIASVKAEQQRITTDAEKSYEAELARLRADLAKRLRAQGATPKSAPGDAAAPDLPNAAPVADDPARVSIPTGLYVRGAELELQLERLQRWVADQVKVDPNK